MFYRFFILSKSGPCSSFHDPVAKSEVFSTDSLIELFSRLSYFLDRFCRDEAYCGATPDEVYLVSSDSPSVCPYLSANKRQLLFGFDHLGKPFRTFGCQQL